MIERAEIINDSNFDVEITGADVPILVDFWAEWCGPCKMLSPIVEAIAGAYGDRAGIYKMNVDKNTIVPQRLGIRGIPTLILFKNGQEQERLVGAVSQAAISKLIDKYT